MTPKSASEFRVLSVGDAARVILTTGMTGDNLPPVISTDDVSRSLQIMLEYVKMVAARGSPVNERCD